MQKELLINDKLIFVYKLPLRKYAELLGAIQELPKHFDLINNKSNEEILANLPTLIHTCFPDIERILKVTTSLTEEDIDNLGLDDFVKVVQALLEVNNYKEIYESVKKMGASRKEAENSLPTI